MIHKHIIRKKNSETKIFTLFSIIVNDGRAILLNNPKPNCIPDPCNI